MADQIIKTWLIIKPAETIPMTKVPCHQSSAGISQTISEAIEKWPSDTLIVAQLTHDNQLWVEDAREYLAIYNATGQ